MSEVNYARMQCAVCGHYHSPCPNEQIAALEARAERLTEALRLTYGYAAAIQRMTAFAPIGFRCSLIREAVSRALPDDEAKRLHDETQIILDAFMDEAAAPAPPREGDDDEDRRYVEEPHLMNLNPYHYYQPGWQPGHGPEICGLCSVAKYYHPNHGEASA